MFVLQSRLLTRWLRTPLPSEPCGSYRALSGNFRPLVRRYDSRAVIPLFLFFSRSATLLWISTDFNFALRPQDFLF